MERKILYQALITARVYVYLNKGTNQQPIFDKPIEIPDVEIMRFSDPYIADWNNDGKRTLSLAQVQERYHSLLIKGPISSQYLAMK